MHISSVSLKCCFSILFAFSISVFVTLFSKFKSCCLSWMLCIVVGVIFSWFSSNHILISLIYSFSPSLALSCSSWVMLSTSLLLSLFTFPSLLFYQFSIPVITSCSVSGSTCTSSCAPIIKCISILSLKNFGAYLWMPEHWLVYLHRFYSIPPSFGLGTIFFYIFHIRLLLISLSS